MIRALLAAALLSLAAQSGQAQSRPGRAAAPQTSQAAPDETGWRAEKCARYRAAWAQALERFGRVGLSNEFVERHEAFLARDCEPPRDVCPRSKEELALANVMVLRAMNAGTASTFPPFACPR
ncbi:MAG: hypothetical protein HZY79_05470 [Rhodoblastus sp.]|nr:MAG: hypothetical protein HZY79_05470 [Rhodoblastus sp.]